MADFFSGSLQSRATRGNFTSMMAAPSYESRYISFDEFVRSKGPGASMQARNPMGFRSLWSEYSNRYPQSARIAVSQDALRQMGGEGALEQGLRQSSEYQRYMQGMKAAGAEQFMLTPQSFAAQDAQRQRKRQETMQEFYKGRGTGEPVGDMSQDQPFKKQVGDKMVKVPVGPKGELLLDQAGQPGAKFATKTRTLPQSEVDRLKMQEQARGLGVKKMAEDVKIQALKPRLGAAQEEAAGREDSAYVRQELGKFQDLVAMDEKIAQDPEYASYMNQGYSAIRNGMSAQNALRYVKGLGGVGQVKEERQRERERLREQFRLNLAREDRDFKIDVYEWEAREDRLIQAAKLAGDVRDANDRSQRTIDGLNKHIGALERAIKIKEGEKASTKDQEEIGNINNLISSMQAEIVKHKASVSRRESEINATSTTLPELTPFPRGSQGEPTGYTGGSNTPAPTGGGMVRMRLTDGREIQVQSGSDLQRAILQRDPRATVIGGM